MLAQRTLTNPIKASGVGLHSGRKITIKLLPAPEDTGIIFQRVDCDPVIEIQATVENVGATALATTLVSGDIEISTVEHMLSAFAGLGIDNAYVQINDIEVPIMDGSAKEFVKIINEIGLKTLEGKRKFVRVKKSVELKKEDGRSISVKPSSQTFDVKFTLNYKKNPLIKTQVNKINFAEKNLEDIVDARTFCLYEDIEMIKSMGLAKGGSLDNAIVVRGNEVLNKSGLRSKKEFVNHKILDLVGDFMLSGTRLIGSVECFHGGHALTIEFLKKIFSNKNNYEVVESHSLFSNVRKIIPLNKRFAVNA